MVAKMKTFSKNENKSDKDRRLGKERRQYNNPYHNRHKKRIEQERRLMQSRRSQIMCNGHFHQ